jgi:translation initiation factor 1
MAFQSKRIPVNGTQSGLNAAFARLEIAGLPEGSSESVGSSGATEKKPLLKPGRVVLRREKAHRGGKTVLVVDGFGDQHAVEDIERLGKRLKAACGCGGTVRERTLEVQGDQPARVRAFLEGEGFLVAGEK